MTGPRELTARACVTLAAELRRQGVPISPEQSAALYTSLHLLGQVRLRDMYWAGRVTLVQRREAFPAYDAAFLAFLGVQADGGLVPVPAPRAASAREAPSRAPSAGTPGENQADRPDQQADDARLTPSDLRLLKAKSFAAMDPAEQRQAAVLVRRLGTALPPRRARRRTPAARGRHVDSRRSLLAALRTDGEPVLLARERNPVRERTLTLVIDVSGSMAPYALPLLRFAHAVMHGGHRVEVFTIGVGLTRITEELRRPSVDAALRRPGRPSPTGSAAPG